MTEHRRKLDDRICGMHNDMRTSVLNVSFVSIFHQGRKHAYIACVHPKGKIRKEISIYASIKRRIPTLSANIHSGDVEMDSSYHYSS